MVYDDSYKQGVAALKLLCMNTLHVRPRKVATRQKRLMSFLPPTTPPPPSLWKMLANAELAVRDASTFAVAAEAAAFEACPFDALPGRAARAASTVDAARHPASFAFALARGAAADDALLAPAAAAAPPLPLCPSSRFRFFFFCFFFSFFCLRAAWTASSSARRCSSCPSGARCTPTRSGGADEEGDG